MNAADVVARPLARVARLPLLAPLAGRDFRLVWLGESVSLLGDQFNVIALSWLVLGMTGSGLALGAILIAAAIPRGLFMLVGGVLSDRVSPRDLALVSNVVRAALTTIVAALVLGARVELWQLALVGVVFGTVDAIFLPAINTLIPRLVPADRLAPANAVMQGTAQLVGTVGPAIAGFAVALIGVGAAFAIDALSFAVAAVALWLVRSGGRPGPPADPGTPDPAATIIDHASDDDAARPSLAGALVAGAREVLGDPVMRSIVVVSTATNLAFTGPTVIGLPWLVLVHFGSDAFALGLLFAAFGAGSLGGVLVAGSTPHPRHFGSIVLGLVLAMGLGLAAVGLAPSLPIVGVIALCVGAMNGYVGVVVIAWVQGRTDPAMLGRTMSFMMLGSVVAAPLSLALAGIVVDTHAGPMFVAAGLLVVGSGIVAFASGLQRRMI
jgi:predicted MFS family arabinose efflux permease